MWNKLQGNKGKLFVSLALFGYLSTAEEKYSKLTCFIIL
jgi:hypothetical protein